MPEKEVVEQAKEDLKEGKSPSTAAGEFVHEEIEHVREGKHGARSPQQAIAIGLSKARRAGIPLPPPRREKPASPREQVQREITARDNPEQKRRRLLNGRGQLRKCFKEGATHPLYSHKALSAHAKKAATSR